MKSNIFTLHIWLELIRSPWSEQKSVLLLIFENSWIKVDWGLLQLCMVWNLTNTDINLWENLFRIQCGFECRLFRPMSFTLRVYSLKQDRGKQHGETYKRSGESERGHKAIPWPSSEARINARVKSYLQNKQYQPSSCYV